MGKAPSQRRLSAETADVEHVHPLNVGTLHADMIDGIDRDPAPIWRASNKLGAIAERIEKMAVGVLVPAPQHLEEVAA